MCNRFQCETTSETLAKFYQAEPIGVPAGDIASKDVVPGQITPGLIRDREGNRQLHPFQFAIAPPNSATPAHPTFDLNIVTIEEPTKWPWLTTIETSRCILPISRFHACSYWGDPEGTEIYFQRADQELLHAVGLYRVWKPPSEAAHDESGDQDKSGAQPPNQRRLYTASLLTRPASDYVMDHGDHRQPILLAPDGIDAWLDPVPLSIDQAFAVLRQHSTEPELTHRHLCPMPDNWTHRQKGCIRKRGQQMAAQDRCQHACGF